MPMLNIFSKPSGDINPRICLGIAGCQNHVCFTEQRAAQAEWEFPAAWKNFGRKRRWRCVVFNQYKYIFPHWQTGCGASLDSPDADDRTSAACLILCVPLGAGEKRKGNRQLTLTILCIPPEYVCGRCVMESLFQFPLYIAFKWFRMAIILGEIYTLCLLNSRSFGIKRKR